MASGNNVNQGLFITGTDTDVGKTIVSAWLCAHFNLPYWKPIQTGLERDTDTISALSSVKTYPEAYHFTLPASPHLSARKENTEISLGNIIRPTDEPLLIEGAGGVAVPINYNQTMLHVMARLDLPVIIVGRSSLGTINHTCLTIQALRQQGIHVLGVILSGDKAPHNEEAIEHYGQVPVLANLPVLSTLNRQALLAYPPSQTLVDYFEKAILTH